MPCCAVVDDCAAAGVKSLVVITAGFAEVGAEGRALQDALVEKARALRDADGRPQLHGPAEHASGRAAERVVLADSSRRRATSRCRRRAARSGSRFSGSPPSDTSACPRSSASATRRTCRATICWSTGKRIPRRAVILLYLESFGNPRRFARIARRVARSKPIVAVKAGRTRAGSRAAGSHTAALAASDAAVDALFHQSGVIRAETIDEMFDIAALLDAQPLPAGSRVAVVTNAGGPGILAVDACEAAGLDRGGVFGRHAGPAALRFSRRPRASATRWTWSRPPVRPNTAPPSRRCWPRPTPTR